VCRLRNILYTCSRYKTQLQNLFLNEYGRVVSLSVLKYVRDKFEDTGSVTRRSGSGRPSIINDEDLQTDVNAAILLNPNNSIRKLSVQAGLSSKTTHRIVREKLNMFPYKTSRCHELLPGDTENRIKFCEWFLQNVAPDEADTFYTDEAWFLLKTGPNRQNFRTWSTENPHDHFAHPLHSEKIGVWAAVSRKRIYYSFFNCTINSQRYIEIVEQFLDDMPLLERQNSTFQQDGAPAHTAKVTLDFLEDAFSGRVISKGLWPPRSPDLNPCDFYLWGTLKDSINFRNCDTIEDVKQAVADAVRNITPDTLNKVFENLNKRINLCMEHGGDLFEKYLK
jgi:hypothetical protein